MKKQTKLYLSILGVALSTELLLLVPLAAMQFSDEVNWSVFDFVIAGVLLFITGLCYVVVTRFVTHILYRAAMGLTLGTTLFLIWANLAVGLIGAGPTLSNLMFMGVVAVVIIGVVRSRLSASGMERAMYFSALAVLLVGAMAMLINMNEYPGSSMIEIAGVTGLFASLYAIAGSLFRYVARDQGEKTEG